MIKINKIIEFRTLAFLPTLAVLMAISGCTSDLSRVSVKNGRPDIFTKLAQLDAFKKQDMYLSVHLATDWWKIFSDKGLDQLEEQLPSTSLDLKLQLSKYIEMASRYDISGATLKPTVGLSASYTKRALSRDDPLASLGMPTTPFDTWNLGLSASWELDFWGYLKDKNEVIRHQLLAQEYMVEMARQSLSAELAKRYLLYQQSLIDLRFFKTEASLIRQKIKLAQDRIQNGTQTQSQLDEITATYQKILAQLSAAKLAIQLRRSHLEELLGLNPLALKRLDQHPYLSKQISKLPIGIPSVWLKTRPDILAAEQNLRASISDVKAAKADFYPRISLTGSIGVESIHFSDITNWDSRHFSVGPSVYLPIFQGGRLKATLALNTAKSKSAAIRYRKVVLGAWHEVDNALRAYSSQLKQLDYLNQSLTSYQQVVLAQRRQVKEGSISQFDLINAKLNVLKEQLVLRQAKTTLCLDIVNIYRSLGVSGGRKFASALSKSKQGRQL